ncbi:MAG TPA: hypothetical protein VMY41_04190 [Thermohalobaculum sp.]|nr:hypothetical protein [Thermohalobaculum sp.]
MIGRYFAMLALIGTVAACDDVSVSGTERRTFLYSSDLLAMQEASGVLVEIHGAPWPGATPEQIASTLRMPDGSGQAVRFRDIAPGQWIIGDGDRLVLHFNPTGAPDSVADCRAKEAIVTEPPAKKGFTVNATFCKQGEWLSHAFLKARAVSQDDWLSYTFAMRELLGKMFPEK